MHSFNQFYCDFSYEYTIKIHSSSIDKRRPETFLNDTLSLATVVHKLAIIYVT
jgi:hypothetical protein